jgi:hypothetical protein
MSLKASFFILPVSLLLLACEKETEAIPLEINPELLVNNWIEEKEGSWPGKMIAYDPNDEAYFTTWRLRNRLELSADGRVSYSIGNSMDPHRHDPVDEVIGTWKYDAPTNTLMISNQEDQVVFAFMVWVLRKSRLNIKYVEVTPDMNAR